jgi:YggT family protein
MFYPNPVVWSLIWILEIYKWIVIVAVIANWLVVLNVISARDSFIRQILVLLDALTEPVFRQVRRVVPPIGGLDLSPIFVFIGIYILESAIEWFGGGYVWWG